MAAWNPKANEIFVNAVELSSPGERRALLDLECGSDAALREQVEKLLQAHDSANSFLQQPASGCEPTVVPEIPANDVIGSRIGPYKLLQEIGQGGMGTVFMAEQTAPVKRMVALKVIKPGMDTAQVVARFEAERQALALMDHPNIARVLDAGTTEAGRPYFVMELVKGVTITKYCDEHQLTPRERMELFVPVCQAIQHAHQKGIIHRDLKPSNVMIASYDGRPVPKVIDFGVAKAMGQQLTERTMFTGFGGIVGTLEYMSPEQAEFNALDVDTRSDIYSLGVVLYELLTGSTPLTKQQLQQAAITEVLRLIREEEPPKPSTRLTDSRDSLASISALRHLDPTKLTNLIRGDLDWIVMKSLEKDRSRRYDTANGLARDLERYLRDEPVEASPPSVAYRLRKLLRKHRGAVAGVTAVAIVLVLGTVVSTWQAVRAKVAEQQAIVEKVRADRTAAEAIAERARADQKADEAFANSKQAQIEKVRADANAVEAQAAARQALVEKDRADANAQTADAHAKTAEKNAAQARAEALNVRRHLYVANLKEALFAWEHAEIRRLNQMLKAQEPDQTGGLDLRGWEWRFWTRVVNSHRSRLELPKKHEYLQRFVTGSEGRQLVGATDTEENVHTWDTATGKLVSSQRIPLVRGTSRHLSSDGTRLAVVFKTNFAHAPNTDFDITVWDVASGQLLKTLPKVGLVSAAAFDPECKRLIVSQTEDSDGQQQIRIYPLDSDEEPVELKGTVRVGFRGKLLDRLFPHSGQVHSVAFSPDGKRVATAGQDSKLRIWDAASGENLFALEGHASSIRAICFSPDGDKMATVSSDSTIKLWDVTQGALIRTLSGHTRTVNSVAFSADGETLASGGDDRTARVWNVMTGDLQTTLKGSEEEIRGVVFNARGELVSLDNYGILKSWDTSRDQFSQTMKFPGISGWKLELAFDAESRQLSVIGPRIETWDSTTLAHVRRLEPKGHDGRTKALSLDGRRFAWIDNQRGKQTLSLFSAESNELLRAIPTDHTDYIISVAFSPDGCYVVTAGQDAKIKVWPIEDGDPITFTGFSGAAQTLTFSPDSGHLLAAGQRQEIHIGDLVTKTERRLKVHRSDSVNHIAVSRDGREFAVVARDELSLWNLATGERLATYRIGFASSVAFHPGGSRLVTAHGQDGVRLWDRHTGQEVLTFSDESLYFNQVAFSPDGTKLAATDRSGTIKIWDATARP